MANCADGSLTWLLVLLGWYVVHRASLSRERRKERREITFRCVDEVKDIERRALGFHTAAAYCHDAVEEITVDVSRLIRRLQRPPLQSLQIPTQHLVRLRQSITLKNADLSGFTAQQRNGEIPQEIRSACNSLIDAIELAREREYT